MGDLPPPQETLPQGAGNTRTCSRCGQKLAETPHRCPGDRAPLLSPEAMARVGTRIGDYELVGVIGEGGTGVVYRGRHVARDKQVAIKILHGHCARKKDLVKQLAGEVRTQSRIHHANIVGVTSLGTTPEGSVFLVTEHLEGESLQDRLSRVSRLPAFEAINILRQAAHGLGAAHAAGIVHGGLKPANLLLCQRKGRRRIVRRSKAKGMRLAVEPEASFDLVKLLDFGMTRFLDLGEGGETRAGALCDALHYLSPEQAQGQPADLRSDIYALGAILYEMVTGSVPFDGESPADILKGHVSGRVIPPSRRAYAAGMSMRIDGLILRCLEKNPSHRFVNTDGLCEALDACVTDCAFLRDAHRLPGIAESGIDLSEGSREARHDPAQATEKLAEAPVARPTAVPGAAKPAPTPVARKPAEAPTAAQPAAAPVARKPAESPTAAQPAAAPVAQKPALAQVLAKLTTAPSAEKPAPVHAEPTTAPVAEKPAAATPAAAAVAAPMANAPAAAVTTPLPATVTTAGDPAAAMVTPPPVAVGAGSPGRSPAGSPDESGGMRLEPPQAVIPDLEERPARFRRDKRVSSGRRTPGLSRRPQAIALVGVLLLGGAGVALWAARRGSAPKATGPVVAAQTTPAAAIPPTPAAPAPAAAIPPTPAAPAPAAAIPPTPAAPAPAAPTPPSMAPPTAAAPPAAVTAPAPATASAVQPAPGPAAHAKTAKAKRSGKLAASRPRAVKARGARRGATAIPAASESASAAKPESAPPAEPESVPAAKPESAPAEKPESAPAAKPETASPAEPVPATEPAAKSKPQPEAQSPTPSAAAGEPEPTPPAPPTVDEILREAEHAWSKGHHARAILKARTALGADASPAQVMQAYEVIGRSSCARRDADTAREAASHLNDAKRETVKSVCEKNGVSIE